MAMDAPADAAAHEGGEQEGKQQEGDDAQGQLQEERRIPGVICRPPQMRRSVGLGQGPRAGGGRCVGALGHRGHSPRMEGPLQRKNRNF